MTTTNRIVISREQFLAETKTTPKDVPMPEFGPNAVIPVWPLSAKEWTQFQSEQLGKDGKPNAKAKLVRERLVVRCCRDDYGVPLFTEEDIAAIGAKNCGIVERLVNAALQVSGITSQDVEELAKNSDATQPA
jgi:hypothetical protein